MRLLRLAGLFVVLLAVLAGAVAGGVWYYLATRPVAAQVASRLEAALGLPVAVGSVEIGPEHSSLHDLQFFAPGAGSAALPWAEVRQAEVDVSAWDVLTHKAIPKKMTLRGVTLTLHVNREGKRLTQLPTTGAILRSFPGAHDEGQLPNIPNIQIEEGRLVVRQEGKDDLILEGIEAQLRAEGDAVVLEGTIADDTWGDWALRGSVDRRSGAVSALVETERPVDLQRAMLAQLPFVTHEVWEQVQVQGEATGLLALHSESGEKGLRCRAVLRPQGMAVRLPCIDLDARRVHGKIVLDGATLRLEELRGRAADGEVEVRGAITALDEVPLMKLVVKVQRARVQHLPKAWGIPSEVGGFLTGHADLHSRLVGPQTVCNGKGEGVIADAHVADLSAGTVGVVLFIDNGVTRFALRQPRASHPAARPATGAVAAVLGPPARFLLHQW